MPLRRRLGNAKRWLQRTLSAPLPRALSVVQALRTRARIAAFKQQSHTVRRFPAPVLDEPGPVVVAVVTHVTTGERPREVEAERVARTLEGLLESLGHTRLELVLNTMPERHVADDLPEHLRARLVVRERTDAEPLFLGFAAQAEFEQRAETADWFLYLEDDIVLDDGMLLDKLAFFEQGAPPEALLLPHRYEFWHGRKTYVDLISKASPEICAWNRLTELEIGGWKFVEYENPHSGFYALSRRQLGRWLETGRHWSDRISWVAARESAATGCLGEAFRLYKPHPRNMTFLEVRHWDTRVAERNALRHGLEEATTR
jgi:hypothetical protein